MAEEDGGAGAKVRVVRCPKCDKLLPEPAHFSVYRCGGCDAALQARKQPTKFETSLGKSGEDVSKYCDNIETSPEKKALVSAASSEDNIQNHKFESRKEKNAMNELESPTVVCFPIENGRFQLPSMFPLNDVGKCTVKVEGETKSHVEYATEYPKIQRNDDWDREDVRRASAFNPLFTSPIGDADSGLYPDAGLSSNDHPNYGLVGEGSGKRATTKGSSQAELLGKDNAELLKKLDELREQLQRSCEVAEVPKEGGPVSSMATSLSSSTPNGRGGWFSEGSSVLINNASLQSPFLNGHYVDVPQFRSASYIPNGVHENRDASGSYSLPRAPFHRNDQYLQRPNNFYGQFDRDSVIPHQDNGFCRQPACACMYCYNGHWFPPARVQHAFYGTHRVPFCPLSHNGVHIVDGSSVYGFQGHNSRTSNAPLHSHKSHHHPIATFHRNEGRPCRPFAGAAPFIVCYNCSELLQVPEEVLLMEKNFHKLRCGSCSELITFKLDGINLVSAGSNSTFQPTSASSNDACDGAKDVLQCRGNINRNQVISFSCDYAIPSCDVQSESPDSVICHREVSRASSLPLREHFGYPLGNEVVDGPGSGSRSKRSDQEKAVPLNNNFKQNSVKDVQVATEMDFSAEDYPNASLSQESWDLSKDEEQPRAGKGGESFLAGLIKRGLKDFSRVAQSTENRRCKVTINGHPISDRLVKRAEKFAGPICSGEYWYDYRAGFWGTIGHACLGIIPPFIEEFNYPMLRNCAGGNTGVVVNGRELHEKDLALLAGRGLPNAKGRSYTIEISGKVWDEETSEELESLGKLAPTVEKVKHGFGMRVPRVIARSS
ncbi:Uncharacterized protein AXF42_Ash005498 [Apostasia shenzhenica]|uniref:Uncharacterized protein n=1 Tax=Apostasia shenzhenica TaxID=1088818 RepID=A0A2I0B726_9ASPA|nr:Uncharacterized protein AXF42_Ash005498 [Apostasia shenzhenica]